MMAHRRDSTFRVDSMGVECGPTRPWIQKIPMGHGMVVGSIVPTSVKIAKSSTLALA